MIGDRLYFGDTIGVIAPSSCESEDKINEKLYFISQLGFKIKKGKHIYDKYGYLAGSDADRASDFNDMFKDPKVKAIICLRGGYGCNRMLKYIDWSLVRKNPKIFCGFSDITLLLNELYNRTKLVTFHAPMVTSDLNDSITRESLLSTLMKGSVPYNIPLYDTCNFKNFNRSVKGKIVGGNLTLICSSLGTPYEINTKDKILFLEETNEPCYVVDRMINQLINSKKLSSCRAIILGYFSKCPNDRDNNDNFTIPFILNQLLSKTNIPILFNFKAGHQYPNITIPIGASALIDNTKKTLSITEQVVKNCEY